MRFVVKRLKEKQKHKRSLFYVLKRCMLYARRFEVNDVGTLKELKMIITYLHSTLRSLRKIRTHRIGALRARREKRRERLARREQEECSSCSSVNMPTPPQLSPDRTPPSTPKAPVSTPVTPPRQVGIAQEKTPVHSTPQIARSTPTSPALKRAILDQNRTTNTEDDVAVTENWFVEDLNWLVESVMHLVLLVICSIFSLLRDIATRFT